MFDFGSAITIFLAHGLWRHPSGKLPGARQDRPLIGVVRGEGSFQSPITTRKKNTLEMTKVKRKILGRPRRSQNEVDLHAIGQRIRQIRDEVTQEDFALSLGISQAQLSKYELGQSALPLGALVKLTLKFGRTADWILTGKS